MWNRLSGSAKGAVACVPLVVLPIVALFGWEGVRVVLGVVAGSAALVGLISALHATLDDGWWER